MLHVNRTVKAAAVGAVCAGALGALAWGQSPTHPDRMAPLAKYLMPRAAEIALARTAAPAAIASAATVLVLGPNGFTTAVPGRNGYVCLVERSWISAIDFSEVWNSKIRGPDCLNPPAVRSILPIYELKTKLELKRPSRRQVAAALRSAFKSHQLPALQAGAMGFMMSRQAYLTDSGGHNLSHLMVFTNLRSTHAWGAGVANSPVDAAFFWFPEESGAVPLARGLPMIQVLIVHVPRWSDGTLAVGSH